MSVKSQFTSERMPVSMVVPLFIQLYAWFHFFTLVPCIHQEDLYKGLKVKSEHIYKYMVFTNVYFTNIV